MKQQSSVRVATPVALPEEQVVEHYDKALRPRNFNELIGQDELVANLRVFVQAARERNEALDHILLCGPPGLGKTTIAHLLAFEMQAQLHLTSGPALEKRDLAGLVSHLQENDVLFVDECHRLSKIVEEQLYPAMEDFTFELILGEGPQARAVQMPLPRFTLVGATTRLGLLTAPLRDRFGFIGRLRYYRATELMQIIERSAKLMGVHCLPEGIAELAHRARGTPRIANRLLRRVRDFAEVEGNKTIDLPLAQYALQRLGVDAHGFDEMDRRFLQALVEKFDGGPVGVETLGATLSEEPETVAEVVEPYLLQEGFIRRTPRGRCATPKTYRYLGLEA